MQPSVKHKAPTRTVAMVPQVLPAKMVLLVLQVPVVAPTVLPLLAPKAAVAMVLQTRPAMTRADHLPMGQVGRHRTVMAQ